MDGGEKVRDAGSKQSEASGRERALFVDGIPGLFRLQLVDDGESVTRRCRWKSVERVGNEDVGEHGRAWARNLSDRD